MAYTENDFEMAHTDEYNLESQGVSEVGKTKIDELIDMYFETMDAELCAKEFNKSIGETIKILTDFGVI